MTKAKNKLLAAFIVAIITVVTVMFIVPPADASAEVEDGSVFSKGNGTEGDPYQISTVEQLNQLAQLVSLGNTNYTDKIYELTANIDLDGKAWTPIGTKSDPFAGTFDGNGHIIKNLTLTGDEAGLFGYNDGTIRNVYLDEVNISSTGGGVAALCYQNNTDATIECCAVLGGSINAVGNYGTAAGICSSNHGEINKCYNMAAVSTQYKGAGIVYNNCAKGTVSNCYNAGEVSAIYNSTQASYIGGICVEMRGNSPKIEYCLNFGEVITAPSDSYGSYGAGILCIGYSGTVTDCYSDSDVCSAKCVANGGSAQTNVAKKTTADLCDLIFLSSVGFDSNDIWDAGKTEEKSDSSNTKFKTATYTYPRLTGVTKTAKSETRDLYNFGTDSDEDWQKYTLITDADGLAAINDNLEGNYVLGDDIDLAKVENWEPIGTKSDPFTGTFDGNGFTISNLTSTGDKDNYAGLFGANDGTIRNVYLDTVNISTDGGQAAAVCAVNNAGATIEGCAVLSGSVEASYSFDANLGFAAGICSTNLGEINKCYNMAAVSTQYKGAGIVCYNYAKGTVSNCYNAGVVSAIYNSTQASYIAGICASNYEIIKNCLNFGEVITAPSDSYDSYGSYGAGILCMGYSGTVTNCYSDSDACSADCVYYCVTKPNVGTKTTAELCGALPVGFGGEWAAGTIADGSANGRFVTKTYTYPSLTGVTKAAKSETRDLYNFGTGSDEDWQKYTLITDADGLAAINDNLEGNYVLGDNITLTDEWTPIGSDSEGFEGKFSGDGHTISGLNLESNENYIGLFGSVERGLIMNLAVEGNVKGNNCVGIICGNNNGGTIINCYAIGSVEASDRAGGICGSGAPDSRYTSTVRNCYFSGTVKVSEENAKDAIGHGVKNVENCYYNSDLYTYEGSSGTGMSTFELTSSDALTKMSFTDSIWTKKANQTTDANGENGKAYFPSFNNSGYVPSVDFSADITFERTDVKELAIFDTFEVKYGVKIAFANDGSKALVNGTDCTLEVFLDNESGSVTLYSQEDTFETAVQKAGNHTYSLICTPIGAVLSFLPTNGVTKSFTIDAAKIMPTASDFEASLPQNPTYNGKPHTATVTVATNSPLLTIGGYGDITVKYFDSTGKQVEPINAGEYTVKIDVSGGDNCDAAKDITADSWKFTIAKATYNSAATNVEYSWETTGEEVVSVNLPTDMGAVGNISDPQITDENSILSSAEYKDGKVSFTFSNNTDQNIGNKAEIIVVIESQNYESITVNVNITLNGLANQSAPSLDEFDIVQTNSDSDITVEIKSDLTGVEYSFDGVTWGDSLTTPAVHDTLITGYIRYKQTATHNASATAYKQIRTAHGDISATHHEGKAATCTEDGNIEYWECDLCDKKFSDEAGTKEQASVVIPAGHSLTYIARVEATCTKTGNIEYWSCSECGKLFADASADRELTSAETVIPASGRHGATEIRNKVDPTNNSAGYTGDTVCIDCGEIITHGTAIPPIDSGYKPSVPTPSAATPSAATPSAATPSVPTPSVPTPSVPTPSVPTPSVPTPSVPTPSAATTTTEPDEIEPDDDDDTLSEPYIVGENGKIGWDAILNTINSTDDGDTIIIDMNGTTELPKTILEGIMGSDITLVLDMGDGFEWEINGNDVTAPRDVDMGVSKGANIPVKVINAVTGEFGYVTITLEHDGEFGFKAVLRVDLGKDSKGLFANLYYYLGKNKTELIDSGKIDSDGRAELEFTHASEYVVVIDDYDHTAKPADDTGDEVIVVPSDSEDANPATGVTLSLVAILMIIAGAVAAVLSKKRK